MERDAELEGTEELCFEAPVRRASAFLRAFLRAFIFGAVDGFLVEATFGAAARILRFFLALLGVGFGCLLVFAFAFPDLAARAAAIRRANAFLASAVIP